MFSIVNWLLTRKCNLKCEYCGLVHESEVTEYPRLCDMWKNEKDSNFIIKSLEKIKNISPDCFHIFYGGEPLLFEGLYEIINYCNYNNIKYTIITNGVLFGRLEDLYINCKDNIRGLTCSCDPVNLKRGDDRAKKTFKSFEIFKWAKEQKIEDVVAEMTLDKMNFHYAPEVVKKLEEMNVWTSITCYDPPKNKYYDFSVSDDNDKS